MAQGYKHRSFGGHIQNYSTHNRDGSSSREHLLGVRSPQHVFASMISESNGTPLFYNGGIGIYSKSGNYLHSLKGSDSVIMGNASNLTLRLADTLYHILRGWEQPTSNYNKRWVQSVYDDYKSFDTVVDFANGIYCSEIIHSSTRFEVLEKNMDIAPSYSINKIIAVSRIKNYQYLLLLTSSRNYNKCYVGTYDINGLEIQDSITFEHTDYFKADTSFHAEDYDHYQNIADARFSFNLDKLFISRESKIMNYHKGAVYKYSGIEMFSLNEDFKVVSNPEVIRQNSRLLPVITKQSMFLEKYHYNRYVEAFQRFPGQMVVSPNDSIFYYYVKTYVYDSSDLITESGQI